MAIQEQLLTVTSDDAIGELQSALAGAPDAHRLLTEAWEWYRVYVGADILGVVTLGPPEPVGYLFTDGPLDTCARDVLWERLVAMAMDVRPEPGMYPRRAGDRRTWHGSGLLPVMLDTVPEALGPWTVHAAGKAAARVVVWQITPQTVDLDLLDAMPEAAALTALYLRNLQWMDIEPDPEPSEPMTFEELLESEVSSARRKRVPVSLALIEYRLRDADPWDFSVPQMVRDEVEEVVRLTARRGDRILSVGEACLAVVMPKTDARGALVGADRLQKALYGHFAEREPRVAVQIGIGGRDPEETQASELFARASQALAEARSAHGEAAFVHI
jgi:GGDEF domain-containing protein